MFGYTPAQIRKAIFGFVGTMLMVAAAMLPVDSPLKALIEAALAVGVSYGVFRIPNELRSLDGQTVLEHQPLLPSNVNVRRNTEDL